MNDLSREGLQDRNQAVTANEPVSMLGHIFGAQIKRLGVIRTVSGGLAMYLCIPILVMLHMTIAVPLYQWLICPLLGLKRVRWSDHVFLDRNRIKELTWFDKFNCDFCAYANGLCTMINLELDHLSRRSGDLPLHKKAILTVVCWPVLVPVVLIGEIVNIQLIYNTLVSRPLGMHRTSIRDSWAVLKDGRYAEGLWPPLRLHVRLFKSSFLRFARALEQIESSWCPLKHLETRKGVVFPDHHDKFFGPRELDAMYRVLRSEGTVSDRKPLY